jgi:DNA polymerase-1
LTTTLLLDADIIAFKVASVSQSTYQFPGCEPSTEVDDWETEVVPRIHEQVSKLTAKLETEKVIVCLSCPTAENWRLKVLPTYKGNRDYSKRPLLLQKVKDYLEANWPSYRRPTLEADDIMGILSTHPTLVPGKKIIVSEDKDMKTIPGWLFNPAKDRKPKLIDEHEADYWHLYQTLVGDATDGYAGCPGIGPVRAAMALADMMDHEMEPEDWHTVRDLFILRGLTEEDALVQARVARICRASDYEFKEKRVRLWTP